MPKEISPLDGRYAQRLQHLGNYFSEFALMRLRVIVELRFLEALNDCRLFEKLNRTELTGIKSIAENFSEQDYLRIKEIEKEINHDVKACEIFLREKLALRQPNLIHFGLTSEDINNLAYSFLFKKYLEDEQIPQLNLLMDLLLQLVKDWRTTPFPARTHGQMASPTTAGKELAVFLNRLLNQSDKLKKIRFSGKLNGATGNYSALTAAFPDYNWLEFSRNFMDRYGLEANLVTTQIEDHDRWIFYFSVIRQINNIILDLDRDIWLYLTLGYLTIQAEAGAVGSSTMPHKVNPINFENSEGNLCVSNALLCGLIDKLGTSRLQRDLSDSTVTRNIGVALAHSYLAIAETMTGIKKLQLNEHRCQEELDAHPELLAEPIQTILRREGVDDPYNLLKEITRGKRVSKSQLMAFIEKLNLSPEIKKQLQALDMKNYLGLAPEICDLVIEEAEKKLHPKTV